jgi:hypothetical protein
VSVQDELRGALSSKSVLPIVKKDARSLAKVPAESFWTQIRHTRGVH